MNNAAKFGEMISQLDPATSTFIGTTMFVFIGILMVLVAFFLKYQFNILQTVKETVDDLKLVVALVQKQQKDNDPRTERRLNVHSRRLDEHENRLTNIETRCMLIQENKKCDK